MLLNLQDDEASLALTATEVQATTTWCKAAVPLALGPEELPRLADGLRRLASNGHGSLLWTNEGGQVRIEVVMAKRGDSLSAIASLSVRKASGVPADSKN